MSVAAVEKEREKRAVYQAETRRRLHARRLLDRWARKVITTGGFAVIASILAIMVFLALEVWPLFRPARVTLLRTFTAEDALLEPGLRAGPPLAAGLDENREIGYLVFPDGNFLFFSPETGTLVKSLRPEGLGETRVTAVWQSLDGTRLVLGTADGQAAIVDVRFNSRFYEGQRTYRPQLVMRAPVTLDSTGQALTQLAYFGEPDESLTLAALTADGRIRVWTQATEESLFGEAEVMARAFAIPWRGSGRPISLALGEAQRYLYVGTDDGKLSYWRLPSDTAPEFVSTVRLGPRRKVQITALQFLLGGRTLVVGDADGQLSAWFTVRDTTSVTGWRLRRIRRFREHSAPVTALAASARNKGFISADAQGKLMLHHSTSGRTLVRLEAEGEGVTRFIHFAPKSDAALSYDAAGRLRYWRIDNPHPEAGWKAFFGKVWYEGYDRPEYVWQSTGGSDEFEPKLSLVPLIFGSLKGTLYALIIAVPLALLGAVYTSQFMHPTWRNYVKPTIEIMAALPSVVLGFLAGLWLAPRVEHVVPAILLMLLVLPLLTVLCAGLWRALPRRLRGRFRAGVESLLLVPVLVLGVWLCLELNSGIERALFDGNFKHWLYSALGLTYDQRNALVVGIAMGFAVIPIIYTISEDALSNVPKSLVSASLALGATPWQTAVRVVVPTAAAGMFSAVMIGFGRAVGETMIVLMATGNTPIMDWNIFNGFRTLAANIAVEIPEAPVGGTLYRVLFLSALLLFAMTFVVNSLAELVRQKLREKYQKL